jgi:mono/diheme cytochrome c family protein
MFTQTKFRKKMYILAVAVMMIILPLIWSQRSFSFAEDRSNYAANDAQTSPSVSTTPASSDTLDGKGIYEQNCLSCHAVDGHGNGKYPDIVSETFKKKFSTYEIAYDFISRSMPQNSPGSLKEEEYKAVTKYVQSLNGIPTDFSDISGYFAENEIKRLWDGKIIDGYTKASKLYFMPNQNITRAEFVRYLVKAKEVYVSDRTDSGFTDIAKSKDQTAIITAVEYGWINGYEDHTFRPDHTITRAEIAAILTRSELLSPASSNMFADVPSDHWAREVIGAAGQSGLFNGYEDGTFHPSSSITRGEAAVVIYRLLNPAG